MNRYTVRLACGVGMALMLAVGCAMQTRQTELTPEPSEAAKQQLAQADEFLRKGLLDSALAAFGLALEENPRIVDAHLGMGHVYRQHENYDLAGNHYEQAAHLDPTNYDAHYYLGLMRQLAGRIQQAITAYLQALAINPNALEANRDLASAYLQTQATYQALPYAQRATELNPEDQNAWYTLATTYSLLGQHQKAVDAYRQAAELGDLAEPVMLGLADAHLKLGNYQQAMNVLRTYMRVVKTPAPLAHERLGYALFQLRQFDESLASYRNALAINPDDVAALNGAGACLMTLYIQSEREKFNLRDQALTMWRRSLTVNPDQERIIDLLSRFGRL